FILPSGHIVACSLHICRTLTRRAERRIVDGIDLDSVPELIVVYVNRLSDYFFVLSRFINFQAGIIESPWKPL
ncbi:MAG: ATP:cob(I)alamin adenosyltransferase, partial [Bdellovibrionales bacterium]|nr:ATP:cob(I)alamin adenosyltransferase [Bdellovibrionales bacterium]